MKKILYLTFYFEPDLCAGSFRNSPLVEELAVQTKGKASIDVMTTLPNRYSTFEAEAPQFEERDNYTIRRIAIPKHKSGMKDQVLSFKKYYTEVRQFVKGKKYDLVVASSSRLFTAYLGYVIAKKLKAPLYLDVRDIFYDTLEDVLRSSMVKKGALPLVKRIEKNTFEYASHINLISKGFEPYFRKYANAQYSCFPNGIDKVFIAANENTSLKETSSNKRTIVYAGNIGEGQGLHKIVPQAAKALGEKYQFKIIGDGGAKQKLVDAISDYDVKNVELGDPVKRNELIKIYKEADFLFVHLNDYKAFEKVLPSKIFELSTFPKPIIAGVAGFANKFIAENVSNKILFLPGDVDDLVSQLNKYEYNNEVRTDFINTFKREHINKEMAASICQYL